MDTRRLAVRLRWANRLLFALLLLAHPVQALQVGEPEVLIPGASLPSEARVNRSNNNLDVVEHQGELYLAWRTSITHFASDKSLLQVLKWSVSEQRWLLEAVIETGKDLREPRFLSYQQQLFLYFAELGTNPVAFEPGRTLMVQRNAQGQWQSPQELFSDGFIPWRINHIDGEPVMIGYRGGENIYEFDAEPVQLFLLTTSDGITWEPFTGENGVVLESGVSETDFVIYNQQLVAVGRNEAGDADGWGSKICRADMTSPGEWECQPDPRKFDSPLMLKTIDNIYLIARRQTAFAGRFDLGWRFLPFVAENLLYQAAYWITPKRCAVWQVDLQTLSVEWLADLPSAGDTCFPSAIQTGEGRFEIYNYSSPWEEGESWPWLRGQLSESLIYRIPLQLD